MKNKKNGLLALLGIDLPIVQAPMAGISTPAMAAAVSNAGALGSIAVGASGVAQVAEMIKTTRGQTANGKPFNVNVFCHQPAKPDREKESAWLQYLKPHFEKYDAQPPIDIHETYKSFLVDEAMFELLLAERPAVVSFHFGLPSQDNIDALHSAGIVLFATATTAEEAATASRAGIDAIVAQGYEAGGHRGTFDERAYDERLKTATLVEILAQAVKTPIIAAGGIMDGADAKLMMSLGATAVQMGTAFLRCPESTADRFYRQAIESSATTAVKASAVKASTDSPSPTLMTSAISGRPARCLRNLFTDIGEVVEAERRVQIPDYSTAYDAGKALIAAAKARSEGGYGSHWAGQGVARTQEMPAAELVKRLAAEMF
ncbi:MAG: nitronate monooxygenase [Cyanobacteria bacterium REEB67]|nr:nitronate monooxygenase [Cyanobacteria bacterium REEB67]